MSLCGFLNCHKPPGLSSRDLVNIVQRRIRPTKVGHCGTLDPLAAGVLVVGVGPAVRLTSYVQDQPKHYVGRFRLAASSETGDLENGYREHPELPVPTIKMLQQAAAGMVGSIEQVPPAYSAIWIDGKRAYQRARGGETVVMPPRQVQIHSLAITEYEFPHIQLDIQCGSGTYIRTLGIDLAQAVGSTAVMTELVRVGIGNFQIEDAVSIDQLREDSLESMLLPALSGVPNLPKLMVDQIQSERLGNGLCLDGSVADNLAAPDQEVAAVSESGHLRAILKHKPRGWCPIRVFPV